MSPDVRARLEREAAQPDDIAPVMGCGELRALLVENARLVTLVGALLPLAKDRHSYLSGEWPDAARDQSTALVIEAAERTLGQVSGC